MVQQQRRLTSKAWKEDSCTDQHLWRSHSWVNLYWGSGRAVEPMESRTVLIQNVPSLMYHREKEPPSQHCREQLPTEQSSFSMAVTWALDSRGTTLLRAAKVSGSTTPSCGFSFHNRSKWVPGTLWTCGCRPRNARILGGNNKLWPYQWCQQQVGRGHLFRPWISVVPPGLWLSDSSYSWAGHMDYLVWVVKMDSSSLKEAIIFSSPLIRCQQSELALWTWVRI